MTTKDLVRLIHSNVAFYLIAVNCGEAAALKAAALVVLNDQAAQVDVTRN